MFIFSTRENESIGKYTEDEPQMLTLCMHARNRAYSLLGLDRCIALPPPSAASCRTNPPHEAGWLPEMDRHNALTSRRNSITTATAKSTASMSVGWMASGLFEKSPRDVAVFRRTTLHVNRAGSAKSESRYIRRSGSGLNCADAINLQRVAQTDRAGFWAIHGTHDDRRRRENNGEQYARNRRRYPSIVPLHCPSISRARSRSSQGSNGRRIRLNAAMRFKWRT